MISDLYQEHSTGSREDFLKKLKSGDFDGVVVIYRSNESTGLTGPFNKELIDAAPSSLKFITHNGMPHYTL